jgi:cytochrome c551/c552
MNRTVPLPGYPQASIFMVDGLMANTPGFEIGEQLNGMSAFQHRLAPPPFEGDGASTERGAAVFVQAGCQVCHSGRYFTNNLVLPQQEVGTQPSRAKALAAFPRIFIEPQTYAPNTPVPMPDTTPHKTTREFVKLCAS